MANDQGVSLQFSLLFLEIYIFQKLQFGVLDLVHDPQWGTYRRQPVHDTGVWRSGVVAPPTQTWVFIRAW